MSKDVPNSCPPTKCIFCDVGFVYDNDKEYIKILQNEIDREIIEKLDFIKFIYSNDYLRNNPDGKEFESLKAAANKIVALANQKAVINIYDLI